MHSHHKGVKKITSSVYNHSTEVLQQIDVKSVVYLTSYAYIVRGHRWYVTDFDEKSSQLTIKCFNRVKFKGITSLNETFYGRL